MPDEQSDRRDALPQGCILRDYTIQEVLGHGGFGIVYKARSNELGHVVAIKEYLPSELAVRHDTNVRARSGDCEAYFAEGLRRFREEAKALIEFPHHPSIVQCRDFFRANGTAYLVMEYVEGLPLSELLRQREDAGEPFNEHDLLAIAIPLAQGLAHIHRTGVIHRDIKPANILVRRSDQQPVLIDFGAAKQVVAEHSRSLAPYTEGYAALEQVADGRLGPWTDLYGFGAVLWRIVAGGNPPWVPPNPVKVESRANARLQEAADPLPAAKELGAGRYSEQLLELIDRCLRLSESERLSETDDLVQLLHADIEKNWSVASAPPQALRGSAPDQSESLRPKARPIRVPRGRFLKKGGLAAAAAVAVALVAVALVSWNEPVETPQRWGFSIEVEPPTAVVALLNEPEAYRPGMLLLPGHYEVSVSAPGFATRQEWVTHSESTSPHRFVLEPLEEPNMEPSSQIPSRPTEEATDSTVAEAEPALGDSMIAPEPLAEDPVLGTNQVGADNQARAENTVEPEPPKEPEPLETDPDRTAELKDPPLAGQEQLTSDDSNASDPLAAAAVVANDQVDSASDEESGITCGSTGGPSCFELGEAHRKGDGAPLAPALAAQYYLLACNGENAQACGVLGQMYFNGEGVSQDRVRAAELYWQACDGRVAWSCSSLGQMYFDGEGVLQNRVRATELYQRGCDGADASGCGVLGQIYFSGEGASQDRVRAAELFWQACNGGMAWGCSSLGQMHFDGEGVVQDRVRAAELYRKGCDGGNAWGCGKLGYSYSEGEGVRRDRVLAAGLHQKACDGGVAWSCTNLGNSYHKGWGVRRDRVLAVGLYQKACDGGDDTGCANLGNSYLRGTGVRRDPDRANQLYRRACEGDVVSACASLGWNYVAGIGVAKDRFVASTLFEKACEGGFQSGFGTTDVIAGALLGGVMGGGGFGATDVCKLARTLVIQACKSGHAAACKKLQTLNPR